MKKYVTFAAGWLRVSSKDGSQFISCRANGEKSKVKLLLELESGEVVPADNFIVSFNKEKKHEKSPDVSVVFSHEQ